jgi:predicted DNA-binding transcriptional regulator AlpA
MASRHPRTPARAPATTQAASPIELLSVPIERATLSAPEAAHYVGLSVATFQSEVRAGSFPPPLALKARRRLWSRASLDAALVRLHGGSAPDAISEAIDAYEP